MRVCLDVCVRACLQVITHTINWFVLQYTSGSSQRMAEEEWQPSSEDVREHRGQGSSGWHRRHKQKLLL